MDQGTPSACTRSSSVSPSNPCPPLGCPRLPIKAGHAGQLREQADHGHGSPRAPLRHPTQRVMAGVLPRGPGAQDSSIPQTWAIPGTAPPTILHGTDLPALENRVGAPATQPCYSWGPGLSGTHQSHANTLGPQRTQGDASSDTLEQQGQGRGAAWRTRDNGEVAKVGRPMSTQYPHPCTTSAPGESVFQVRNAAHPPGPGSRLELEPFVAGGARFSCSVSEVGAPTRTVQDTGHVHVSAGPGLHECPPNYCPPTGVLSEHRALGAHPGPALHPHRLLSSKSGTPTSANKPAFNA